MTHILGDMEEIFVYLDDVLVYSKDEASHMRTLEEIFRRLDKAGLAISKKKCIFGVKELEFVGYTVNKSGIAPIKRKLEAIAKFPSPQKQKQLLGFLGAINYYRRCLGNLAGESPATILQPLYAAATHKLQPRMTFEEYWKTNGLQSHFEKAKKMLMGACQLSHPDPSAPLALTTDASDKAVGGVLEQYSNGCWRPLGFWSRHIKEDKQKWTVYQRASGHSASNPSFQYRDTGETPCGLYRSQGNCWII